MTDAAPDPRSAASPPSAVSNPPVRATGPGATAPASRRASAALSASRAKDFKQCPLMFRLRTIDRLPEPGSLATHKGTLVHAVLERLFDLKAGERTPEAALSMLPGQWEAHRESHPEVLTLFESEAAIAPWLEEARELLRTYFRVENPQRLAPAQREMFVQTRTRSGLLLRGFVDRLDVAPDGSMRVVDYKTGRSPAPRFQAEALFQMRFYALVLWRMRGAAPRRLQLVYLKDGRILSHDPVLPELEGFEHEIDALWEEIEDCARTGDFRPQRSPLCGWCAFQDSCPLFGGTVPEIPADGVTHLLSARQAPAVG